MAISYDKQRPDITPRKKFEFIEKHGQKIFRILFAIAEKTD